MSRRTGRTVFSFFIALRYFFSGKSAAAVNVIAFISVMGIALVAVAMVAVLSVFNGFEVFTDSQLSSLSPEYVIEKKDGSVFRASDVSLPGLAPVLKGEAVATYEGNSQPIELLGVDSAYLSAVAIRPAVFEGDWDLGSPEAPGAVIGIGVAANLGTGAGYLEPLVVTLPKRLGRISPVMPQRGFLLKEFFVGGVFRVDQKEDRTRGYIPLETMRELLLYDGDEVSFLALPPRLSLQPEKIADSLPDGFVLKDKRAQHPEIYRVLNVEKWVSVLLLVFVLLLSLFSVVSTLGMLILEKREDSAVLAVLGARPRTIDNIVVLESWLLSVTGVLIGVPLGILLVWTQDAYGWLKLGAGGGGGAFLLDAYPVDLRGGDILLVVVVILLIGWLSSRVAYLLFKGGKK